MQGRDLGHGDMFEDVAQTAEQIRRLRKLYELSMTLSGDPLDVFKDAARMIAEIFGVATVCLSQVRGDELRFLSVYEKGQVTLNAGSCALHITPCGSVTLNKEIRTYDRVAERFPEAQFLKDRNAYSYCGFPSLDSSGNVVAVTCLIDPKPHVFTDEDQYLLRIFGQRVGMEIERQRMLEERQRIDSEIRKLSRVVEQAPCAVVITDTEGVISYVNPRFCEITGYDIDEVIGRTPALLKSGATPTETYEELWKNLKSAREWRGEILNRKKSGEHYWSRENISPIRDARGEPTHFVAIEEDITERRRIEERLRDVHKMEAIGQLAGGVAHDFNNLLTVAIGNLELVSERAAGDATLRKLVDTALKGTLRAAELTRKLLAVSRKQPLNPEIVDAKSLLAGLIEIIMATLGETIEVKTIIPEGLWSVAADPGEIETTLLNLAINARDSMPKGGTLTIELANVDLDGGKPHGEYHPGDYVMFAVTDTGTGMTPDVAARAFEPFFTTKEVGKGTGLGLSTVQGFVKQSGGFVELETALGKGTTVRFYLPRATVCQESGA